VFCEGTLDLTVAVVNMLENYAIEYTKLKTTIFGWFFKDPRKSFLGLKQFSQNSVSDSTFISKLKVMMPGPIRKGFPLFVAST
jgi:hypothetical protein